MKYICLGYMDESKWREMSASEQRAFLDECAAYDTELFASGNLLSTEALQSVQNATTLRWSNGKVAVTDGPFTETKEQLAGVLVVEATDLNHAIQIMSRHPGIRIGGCFEVRPAESVPFIVSN